MPFCPESSEVVILFYDRLKRAIVTLFHYVDVKAKLATWTVNGYDCFVILLVFTWLNFSVKAADIESQNFAIILVSH